MQNNPGSDDTLLEQQVIKFAEQLGWLVGTVQAKSEGWLDRDALAAQVRQIRDSAEQLMTQFAAAPGSPGSVSSQSSVNSRGLQGSVSSRGSQGSPSPKSSRGSQGSKGSVKRSVEGKRKITDGSRKRAVAAAKPERGPVDAPGKRHRQPPPSARGIKKSDQSIAKESLWRNKRLRNPRG
jgi:hypothetical protein